MTTTLHNEVRFGARSLLRENWLGERMVRTLCRNETLGLDELAALQADALQRTLTTAIERLPFYRRMPRDFRPADAPDLLREYFPVIDKHTLLQHRSLLYPHAGRAMPWHAVGKTSGTTGTPLAVYRNPQSVLTEHAFIRRHWTWAGFHRGMHFATLRGDLVVPVDRAAPPYWFHNRYNNQLLLSSRHLKDPCVDAMIDALERFLPFMLQAYPSTAYTLALALERKRRRLHIPYVFTASEPLYPHQRELIGKRLGARVMDMFGMAERVAFATECEHGAMHVNPDYSYVELVDEQGQPVAPGASGFVVGTTFHNMAQPLVRYRLSDRTRFVPGMCACGRHFPRIEPVTGKYEDSIYGSDGASVSPSVLTFAFKGLTHIRKSQVAQVAPERWEIRLVPEPGFGEADRRRLVDNVRTLVDPGVTVDVVLTDDLPSTASGKFRWVVNEWKAARPQPLSAPQFPSGSPLPQSSPAAPSRMPALPLATPAAVRAAVAD